MRAQPPDWAALRWWRRKNPVRNRFCCDAALNPWQDFAIRVRTVLLSQFGWRDSPGELRPAAERRPAMGRIARRPGRAALRTKAAGDKAVSLTWYATGPQRRSAR